ncbi:MAG: shikimate dehydrogenase [Williamsia sp.]|nr:shikimate dehydrogenase [Williamsia sp.]
MRVFGLIGFPLSHSFSKKYFGEKFLREQIPDCRYEAFELSSIDQVSDLIKNEPPLQGFNITIPYKQEIIPFLHKASKVVKQIGACNCVKIVDQQLIGYNTDVEGFKQSLQKKLLPVHKQALVLGTGGAAKAVAYVLEEAGISYQYVSRNKAQRTGYLHYDQVDDEVLRTHLLIINTTPTGMYPRIDEAPALNYEALTPQHFLFDLTYNPEKTLFLQKGESRGAAIQNGYDMLVIQAEESWKIWNTALEELS